VLLKARVQWGVRTGGAATGGAGRPPARVLQGAFSGTPPTKAA